MPEQEVVERARRDQAEGKSPSTQAGEFVREEIEHVREGKHGAANTKQAIAIGLSKARRAGVKIPPRGSSSSSRTRSSSSQKRGSTGSKSRRPSSESSRTRSRATLNALKREGSSSVSRSALARQARSTARKRGSAQRHNSAEKAVRTKRKMATLRGGSRRRSPRR